MEAINDCSKSIAKALEFLKGIHTSDNVIEQVELLNKAISLLEEALIKLTDKM